MSNLPAQEGLQDSIAAIDKQERLAAWLQFPRRVIFLLIAYGLASALIASLRRFLSASQSASNNWGTSLIFQRPVAQVISQRLPNTLLLLGVALLFAFVLASLAVLAAVLVHMLEQKTGPLGSILKGLGRLWLFSQAAAPVFLAAMIFIVVLAAQAKLLPLGGMYAPNKQGDPLDAARHILLPALSLALLPAMLAAQATARELTLPRERGGFRLWLGGLLKLWGMLLGQVGGLLSALIVVEVVFAWPGLGLMVINSAMQRDYPLLVGVLGSFAMLVLVGRLLAELFHWLERLALMPISLMQIEPTRWRKLARVLWVSLALVLLLAPLALGAVGLTVDSDTFTKTDAKSRNAPPSAEHPWGTDRLGRDIQARVLRGTSITLGIAALAALAAFIPALLGGLLSGWLASRRVWWSELLADLVLLPADVLLFIPAVLLVAVGVGLQRRQDWVLIVITFVVLLPRLVRVYQSLWLVSPAKRKGIALGVTGPGIVLLGGLLLGFGLVTTASFLGLGIAPPTPSLGGTFEDLSFLLLRNQNGIVAPGLVAWVCCLALYAATDALVGFFTGKEPLARLNE